MMNVDINERIYMYIEVGGKYKHTFKKIHIQQEIFSKNYCKKMKFGITL